MQALQSPLPYFADLTGAPLAFGSLYIGAENDNPETAPAVVYWDAAGTQPVAQPVRVLSGYPSRNGTPALIYFPAPVSLTVKDRNGRLVVNVPSTRDLTVGFLNPMTTPGDLIRAGTAGAAQRLAVGTEGQVLTVAAGLPTWQTPAVGFSNPMTAAGDLIKGGALGVAERLAPGTNGHVLTVVAGVPAWQALPTTPTAVKTGFSARRITSNQTTAGVVVFQDVGFPGGFNTQISSVGYDPATGRFTVPAGAAGWYQFNATVPVDNTSGGDTNPGVGMRLNGSPIIKPAYAIRQGVGSLYVFNPALNLQVGDVVDVHYDAAIASAVLVGAAFSGYRIPYTS